MKIKAWARFLPAVFVLLAGCKGFWDMPSGSSGSGGGNGTASGFFYVLNQKSTQVAGFSFAAGATTLTPVSTSQYSLGAAPFAIAISPSGGFLYVSTAAGIYAYSVNASTGVLTLLNSNNAISADPAFTMVVDPSGGWLIEAVSGVNAVNAIPLDATTGVLLTGASEQTVALPAGATAIQQVTITRTNAANAYAFVAMANAGIAVIPFTSTASGNPFGAVKTYNPVNTASGSDLSVAVDLTSPILYVGETVATSGSNPGGLRMFNIGANSTLTEVTGSPYATGGIGPSAILPTTHYVYVANKAVSGSNSGNITAFALTTTGTTVTLTAVASGTIAAGVSPLGLSEDSTGTYILAVNSGGSPDLNAYTISSTGALTSYATVSTGSSTPQQAVAIAAIP
jgi:6-phosphogluconolactonase